MTDVKQQPDQKASSESIGGGGEGIETSVTNNRFFENYQGSSLGSKHLL